ncbi:MAG: primase C-terminal domain-containing protein, partial [Candidatus Thiodiazotropha sp.]
KPKVASGQCNQNASTTNPKTWRSFKQVIACARKNKNVGIGFVFTEDDPFIGIDLDNKSEDPEIEQDHRFWINCIDSYTERSPSGTGYHIIIKGDQIKGFNQSPYEAYSSGRYFTFTGDVVRDRSVNGGERGKTDFFKIFGNSDHLQFQMPESVEVGNRNDTMFRLACSMHSRGMKAEDVTTLITGFNRGLENPLPSKEVHTLLKSANSYEHENEKRHILSDDESPFNCLTNLSATSRISEMKKNLSNDYYVIMEMALAGQITLFYAWPNTGKTLLFFWFIISGIENGTLIAANIIYVNADDNYKGLYTKAKIAEKCGFHMISPAEAGISPKDLIILLDELANTDDATGKIIFLDTLKKFANMMDKQSQATLYNTLRRLVSKNATVIIAGHANKHLDIDGNLVYEGTSDTMNDVDCVYSIYRISERDDTNQIVEFRREKDRGNVIAKVSYGYRKEQGMHYEDIINSIRRLDETEANKATFLKGQKQLVEQYSCEREFVSEILKDGPKNQSQLLDAFNRLDSHNRNFSRNALRAALSELTDVAWTVERGTKNAAIYTLMGR